MSASPQEETGPPPLQGLPFESDIFHTEKSHPPPLPCPTTTYRQWTQSFYLHSCPCGAQGPRLLRTIHQTGGEAVVDMGDMLLGLGFLLFCLRTLYLLFF